MPTQKLDFCLPALGAAVCSLVLTLSFGEASAQFGPLDPRWPTPLWQDPAWVDPAWVDPYRPVAPWLPPPAAYPVPVPVPVPVPTLPQSMRISSDVVADPPLTPARVELLNLTRDPLRVEIIDLKTSQVVSQQDIHPSTGFAIIIPRHSGGEAIETYRTYGPAGDISDREVRRRIAPQVRYEVAVHRWKMQSIAIDRTGKSPSAIEDIQFAGEPVGRFRLPAGEQLIDGRIDVYRAAVAAANPDSVAPIFPVEHDPAERDPLRDAVDALRR
jgi:hypothetical protein